MISAGHKPLHGVRVLDLSALGPGPYASRIFADHGAEVVTVEAPRIVGNDMERHYGRGKKSIVVDLKAKGAAALLLELTGSFDVLIESMRPGKMESLGLGPDAVCEHNPRLIYTRLTCFGQDGPYSTMAGHDINAIAIGGTLGMCGRETPVAPPTVLGDFAAGSLVAVIGTLLALYDRERTGCGQVVDASMTDGAALLTGAILPLFSAGAWNKKRGTNFFDGGFAFYETYLCKDGKWLAVGSFEPKFFAGLIEQLDLKDKIPLDEQFNLAENEGFKQLIRDRFAERKREDWLAQLESADICVSPVLELDELADHPYHIARKTVLKHDGVLQSGLVPKLSGSDQGLSQAPHRKGLHSAEVLRTAGISEARIAELVESGAVILGADAESSSR